MSVGAVPILLLAVTLLAGAALMMLRSPAIQEPPVGTAADLHATAMSAADALTVPADELVRAVELERAALAADKRSALRRIADANEDVEGLALIDRAGVAVKDRGDDVPLPPTLPAPGDGPRAALVDEQLVVAVSVSADRVLIGSLPLRAPKFPLAPPDQRILLARADGSVVAESGGRPDVPPSVVQAVAGGAWRDGAGFALDDSQRVPQSGTSVLGIPGFGDTPVPNIAAVSGVPAHGVTASSELVVLAVRGVPLTPGITINPGWTAAALVAGGGVLAFVLLHSLLVRPIRRLRDDVEHRAYGEFRRSRLRQADRIARCGAPNPVAHATVGGIAVLVTAGALVLGALAAGFATVGSAQQARTEALIERSRAGVEDTTAALERTLTEGLAAVQESASPTIGEAEFDWPAEVAELHATQAAFRSVYVRDAANTVVASAGEGPRGDRVPATPLAQLNQSGPEPIVTASAPTHDGRFTVVAEFDPHKLNAELRRSGPATEVFDRGPHTVLGSDGYVAFSELGDAGLRGAATAATVTPGALVENVDDQDELVATQRIGRSEATAALDWVVLQHRDMTTARYTVDPLGRAVTVIIGIAALVGVGLLAWCYVTTVGPLHKYGDFLAAVPRGRTVPAGPPPRRLDEVGAVMSGLNHYLQRGGRQ